MQTSTSSILRAPMLIGALLTFSAVLPAAPERTLFQFEPWNLVNGQSTGVQPDGTLLRGPDGSLYGAAMVGGAGYNGTIFRLSPPAAGQTQWRYSVLWTFTGNADGGLPNAELVMDSSGAIYGTARAGGYWVSQGVVFKLTPPAPGYTQWTHRTIHTFYYYRWGNGPQDGAYPSAGLAMDASGALYGTTHLGGSTSGDIYGAGTVFKLTPLDSAKTNWQETVLYRFAGGADGQEPMSAPIVDAAGNIYGATYAGGGGYCDGDGCGTVYRLSPPSYYNPNWTKTTLVAFNGTNGGKPEGKLFRDNTGALFGTTYQGGSGLCTGGIFQTTVVGCGTVYKLTPPAYGQRNWGHSIVLQFNGANGAFPEGGVAGDPSGRLFGVTTRSNTDAYGLGGDGVAYQLTPGAYGYTASVLHYFQLGYSGTNALGELVRSPDGRLYGVAYSGGPHYGGTIFEINSYATGFTVQSEEREMSVEPGPYTPRDFTCKSAACAASTAANGRPVMEGGESR